MGKENINVSILFTFDNKSLLFFKFDDVILDNLIHPHIFKLKDEPQIACCCTPCLGRVRSHRAPLNNNKCKWSWPPCTYVDVD